MATNEDDAAVAVPSNAAEPDAPPVGDEHTPAKHEPEKSPCPTTQRCEADHHAAVPVDEGGAKVVDPEPTNDPPPCPSDEVPCTTADANVPSPKEHASPVARAPCSSEPAAAPCCDPCDNPEEEPVCTEKSPTPAPLDAPAKADDQPPLTTQADPSHVTSDESPPPPVCAAVVEEPTPQQQPKPDEEREDLPFSPAGPTTVGEHIASDDSSPFASSPRPSAPVSAVRSPPSETTPAVHPSQGPLSPKTNPPSQQRRRSEVRSRASVPEYRPLHQGDNASPNAPASVTGEEAVLSASQNSLLISSYGSSAIVIPAVTVEAKAPEPKPESKPESNPEPEAIVATSPVTKPKVTQKDREILLVIAARITEKNAELEQLKAKQLEQRVEIRNRRTALSPRHGVTQVRQRMQCIKRAALEMEQELVFITADIQQMHQRETMLTARVSRLHEYTKTCGKWIDQELSVQVDEALAARHLTVDREIAATIDASNGKRQELMATCLQLNTVLDTATRARTEQQELLLVSPHPTLTPSKHRIALPLASPTAPNPVSEELQEYMSAREEAEGKLKDIKARNHRRQTDHREVLKKKTADDRELHQRKRVLETELYEHSKRQSLAQNRCQELRGALQKLTRICAHEKKRLHSAPA